MSGREQGRGRGKGRGRGRGGDQPFSEDSPTAPTASTSQTQPPQVRETSSASKDASSGEEVARGRGGFRTQELKTIPEGLRDLKGKREPNQQLITIYANFIKVTPMAERVFYKYRVDFEPNIESVTMKKRLFADATNVVFGKRKVVFDGMHDARSGIKIAEKVSRYNINHPADNRPIRIVLTEVGHVSTSLELLQIYNLNMKAFLDQLGYYRVSTSGAYVHPENIKSINNTEKIVSVLGYRTGANVHEEDSILMNLEPVHKLMQRDSVLDYMKEIRLKARDRGGDLREELRRALIGKLVVTKYNKYVYRVEDINFDYNPESEFEDKREGRTVTYLDYYKNRHQTAIRELTQPLLKVIRNNKRRNERAADTEAAGSDIYLVPELCNIAGLTDAQRDDKKLKISLIQSSQIRPAERVEHLLKFISTLHSNEEVTQILASWGYSYEKSPVELEGRVFPSTLIGAGRFAQGPSDRWSSADKKASFDNVIQWPNGLAITPTLKKLDVILPSSFTHTSEEAIINELKNGFKRVNLKVENWEFHRMGDRVAAHTYVQYIKRLPRDSTAALVILERQNKERYDAVKKIASVEKGLITQVVTASLMGNTSPYSKASSASVKIGVQIAAKLGGEPWYVNLKRDGAMVCGYDTYHDTARRGRSYGAFIASMNNKFSRWYSKADAHDHIDELSSHMAENLSASLTRYKKANNNKCPEKVFIYRDGVGDGQLEHVYNTELKQIKESMKKFETPTNKIRLTFIVVNKRIGARFYMKNNNSYDNPNPGTVVDDVVTRKKRYDFYLISQSTSRGTVTPTYYNIIQDTSGLSANHHQEMAYKMCSLYYNWTGTVRVPAPCQYAHKLALLCGEHLHDIPNTNLDDKLHFL